MGKRQLSKVKAQTVIKRRETGGLVKITDVFYILKASCFFFLFLYHCDFLNYIIFRRDVKKVTKWKYTTEKCNI